MIYGREATDSGSWLDRDGTLHDHGEGPTPGTDEYLLRELRNGAWLRDTTFPPLTYAVPGLIPEGFGLLVGAPKTGKSWFNLGVQLGVACGGKVLGKIDAGTPRRVLCLALEDGHRRMQDRCRQLLGDQPIPELFDYLTAIEPGTVAATLDAYLRHHPDTAMVTIDTLGKVMPPPDGAETTYGRDYRIGSRIKRLADVHPGLAVLALHHDRKAVSDDFVARVSGTNGLAGAADTIIVLDRPRQSRDGLLSVTGRDVPEGEYAITLTGAGTWSLTGDDLTAAARAAAARRATANLADRSIDVFAEVIKHPEGVNPTAVATAVNMNANQVGVYLGRLVNAGRLVKLGRGRYAPVPPVVCVVSEGKGQANTTHTTGRDRGGALMFGVAPTTSGPRWPTRGHPTCPPSPESPSHRPDTETAGHTLFGAEMSPPHQEGSELNQ